MSRSLSSAAALRRVALSLLLCSPSGALAQATAADITLEAAIKRALTHGPDIAVERARLGFSEAGLRGANVFPTNPGLSLGAGGRYGFGEGPGLDASVGAQQSLPLFGRWGRAIDAAEAGVRGAQLRLVAEQNRVARDVALAYVASQRARALVEVADRRLELLRSVVHATERRLAAGDGTILDVMLWEAELGQAEGKRARLEADYARARVLLAVLIGVPPHSPPAPATALSLESLRELTSTPPRERPDLVAQRQAVQTAERVVEAESAKAWPDLTVGAGVGSEGAALRQGAPAGELVGSAGVSFPLPVFERNQSGVAAAKATTEREAAVLVRATLFAEAETASAEVALSSALRAAEILKTRVVDKQASSLELLRKAYDAGKLGVTDVLLRQRNVLDAEAAYVTALADLAAARVRLAFANGSLSGRVGELLATADVGGAR